MKSRYKRRICLTCVFLLFVVNGCGGLSVDKSTAGSGFDQKTIEMFSTDITVSLESSSIIPVDPSPSAEDMVSRARTTDIPTTDPPETCYQETLHSSEKSADETSPSSKMIESESAISTSVSGEVETSLVTEDNESSSGIDEVESSSLIEETESSSGNDEDELSLLIEETGSSSGNDEQGVSDVDPFQYEGELYTFPDE